MYASSEFVTLSNKLTSIALRRVHTSTKPWHLSQLFILIHALFPEKFTKMSKNTQEILNISNDIFPIQRQIYQFFMSYFYIVKNVHIHFPKIYYWAIIVMIFKQGNYNMECPHTLKFIHGESFSAVLMSSFSAQTVELFPGFLPTCSSLIPRRKNPTRFQLVHPHVCKQLSNQNEPFLEEASLLFWITVWEIVFPCLVSLRAECSVGPVSHVSLINTPLLVNQAHGLLWPVLPSLIANIHLVICQRSKWTHRVIQNVVDQEITEIIFRGFFSSCVKLQSLLKSKLLNHLRFWLNCLLGKDFFFFFSCGIWPGDV